MENKINEKLIKLQGLLLTKKDLIIGYGLAIFLLLLSINSTYCFLRILKVQAIEWIVFNACVPASVGYLIGFVLFVFKKNTAFLNLAILPLLFFGTMGLFIFPWSSYNIIAQISHITMTLNVIWALYITLKNEKYKSLSIGLLAGMLLYIPFITFQQIYARVHVDALHRILQIK